MATIYNHRDGIITLSAGDSYSEDRTPVESILLTGTAAGAFVLTLGNASLTVSTGTADLTKQIGVNRKLNNIGLTSGPAGATMYVFLRKS